MLRTGSTISHTGHPAGCRRVLVFASYQTRSAAATLTTRKMTARQPYCPSHVRGAVTPSHTPRTAHWNPHRVEAFRCINLGVSQGTDTSETCAMPGRQLIAAVCRTSSSPFQPSTTFVSGISRSTSSSSKAPAAYARKASDRNSARVMATRMSNDRAHVHGLANILNHAITTSEPRLIFAVPFHPNNFRSSTFVRSPQRLGRAATLVLAERAAAHRHRRGRQGFIWPRIRGWAPRI
ncbi:hypothetical protein RHA1_ro08939 (plasmid) [Rhodococcus jostii RHA1]|uniref:Uncharacterized protein n=1 Tax=Rhodococcus jostii (strain RHA1) TaxID=101510 RepID=Q0RXK3_RHOJR|nr:hypothetical protein RHA1_ro08939 [Rhodococcus jostii RHA1]